MSLDEQAEQQLYDAIAKVAALPRPVQKDRIFRVAVKMIFKIMKWELEI